MKPRSYEATADIVQKLTSESPVFGMDIQSIAPINDTLVSIVATVSEVNEEKIGHKLEEDTDNKVAIVPDSVQEVDNPRMTTARFFATINKRMQPATEKVLAGMTMIRANVYADEETNSIWTVEGVGDNKYLVQKTTDDLSDIFQARLNRRVTSQNQESQQVAYASGDFASYITHDGKVTAGMLFGDDKNHLIGYSYDRRTSEVINPGQVLCSVDITQDDQDIDTQELKANISTRQGDDILRYYRKLFGGNPAFFNRLTQKVKEYDGKIQITDTNPEFNEMLRQLVKAR